MVAKGAKPLDLLKGVLAERQAKAQKTIQETGKTWIKRKYIEEKRVEEYLENKRREEEKQKAREEADRQKLEEHFKPLESKHAALKEDSSINLADALMDDDDAEPPIGLGEIIDRLREIGSPITLFGETDMQRYKRLRHTEKEVHEGRNNPDILMLENVHHQQKLDQEHDGGVAGEQSEDEANDEDAPARKAPKEDKEDEEAKSDSEEEGALENAGGDKSDSEEEPEDMAKRLNNGDKSDSEEEPEDLARRLNEGAAQAGEKADAGGDAAGAQPAQAGEELPEVEVNVVLMDKCDFIRTWCRKALKAWEKELADRPEEDKKTALVKVEIAQHRQVRRDVRPLQKRLRVYRMEEWLLDKIHDIVKDAEAREYRNAAEAYLELTIGKAAWPVGIGCGGSMLMEDAIGLHDRFNRMANVKDIAFALNDDVTRKFVQALKRLMTVSQRYWPAYDASKAAVA